MNLWQPSSWKAQTSATQLMELLDAERSRQSLPPMGDTGHDKAQETQFWSLFTAPGTSGSWRMERVRTCDTGVSKAAENECLVQEGKNSHHILLWVKETVLELLHQPYIGPTWQYSRQPLVVETTTQFCMGLCHLHSFVFLAHVLVVI
jgi:hypothetical protein